MSDHAIRVEELSKVFTIQNERRDSLKERFIRGRSRGTAQFKALDDVSFEVPRGTTFGLIGHNGSGKSTMLKILAGVYRPSSGRLLVDGRVSALLELGAGFHG
ncbi:MAG: ABC transporter ATP-binding protein, partial [Actinobacteria bacterium]|nr:ABC transporter ATP-binding protein [Actinomycetota bacterium]